MIMDKLSEFSDNQLVTTTAFGDNVMPLSASGLGVANTQPHNNLVFMNTVAAAGGTSVAFELITSDNEDLSAGDVVATAGTVLTAGLTGGVVRTIAMPDVIYKKYVGVRYTVVGTLTAGAFSAFITPDVGQYRTVDRNYVV